MRNEGWYCRLWCRQDLGLPRPWQSEFSKGLAIGYGEGETIMDALRAASSKAKQKEVELSRNPRNAQ